MKNKRILAMLLALIMMLALAACGSSASAPAANTNTQTPQSNTAQTVGNSTEQTETKPVEPRVLKVSCTLTTAQYEEQSSSTAVMLKYLKEEIAARTNGEIQIELYLDGQLASSVSEAMNGVLSGAFDITNIANGNWNEYTDACVAIGAPFIFSSPEAAYAFTDGEYMRVIEQQIQDETGVVPIGWADVGFRDLTNTKREVRTPEDCKGMKIRVMTDTVQIAAWEALGASCSSLSMAELYTSLQQGVIDAQENPIVNINGRKLFEVCPYMTITNHSYTCSLWFMSANTWNSLTAEQQQIILDVGHEAEIAGRETVALYEQQLLQLFKDNGMQITELTPEETAAFKQVMVDKGVYQLCEDMIGTERWEAFMNAVAEAEAAAAA